MKIDYISDLHLDFWVREQNPQSPKFEKQLDHYIKNIIMAKGGEVLIIAGDLGHYYPQDTTLLKKLKELYKHIFLVRGNHDMYLVSNAQKKRYMNNSMNRVYEMKSFCRENDIHYLDGDIISVDGVTFAGAGMSWDTSFLEKLTGEIPSRHSILEMFNNVMNDSNLIYGGSDNYDVPTAYGGKHKVRSWDPFDYFEKEYERLQRIQDYDDVDVMISHYAPVIPPNMPKKYVTDQTSTFYYFDGRKDLNRIDPKYWIFGHTHDNYDFVYGDTKFLCNPLGYPGENTYNCIKTFEINK